MDLAEYSTATTGGGFDGANYSSMPLGAEALPDQRLLDTGASQYSLLDSRSTIASQLLPPKVPGEGWLEDSTDRNQVDKIAELEKESKNFRRPDLSGPETQRLRKRILELEQLSAKQAREMNAEFSKLVRAMNDVDLTVMHSSSSGNYSSRGSQQQHTPTETYRDNVLREHSRLLGQAEALEGALVSMTQKSRDLEAVTAMVRASTMQEEEAADMRITALKVDITRKEGELRDLQWQLQSAQSDLEWGLQSRNTAVDSVAKMKKSSMQQELEQQTQYLEIISKINQLQVQVEEAEKGLVQADKDLEIESRKMRAAFENHSILANMLKGPPPSAGNKQRMRQFEADFTAWSLRPAEEQNQSHQMQTQT
eukprot:CAMPEP_0181345508 /NCGR_PEP_ID=MMETSP1101-20121128/32787_1 /TAXON_ID=46948 /ORGANISM="Rhodomonas abbreviata, Strain Caron Lab Isolate" /LENGTH=366 /DNA_ID=CAMNT_0023457469 /DNA_START=198 /DNA_END=1298 /DNA_ORIENTATION=+